MHKTIVFALLLAAGCSLYAADDQPALDAGHGPSCIVPPTSREAERFVEDGSSYCPGSL